MLFIKQLPVAVHQTYVLKTVVTQKKQNQNR